MALTFPANPANGQIYDQYVYDATVQSWRVYGSDTGITNVLATKANLAGGNTFNEDQNVSSLIMNRVDGINEGGEIKLNRSLDNTTFWFLDVYGNTTTPDLRIFNNAGSYTPGIIINGSGRVTMPNQPVFYAQGSGTQVLSGAQSNVVIPMTIATENVGNHFNTSTYRFTAPVAGKYFFWTQAATTDATSTGPEINILKNGSVLSNLAISYNSAFYNTFGAPIITTLAANDYIQMAITNNNGTTFTVERGRSRFAGYLIG